MSLASSWCVAAVVIALLAGCATPVAPSATDVVAPEVAPSFDQEHDHRDAALHAASEGLRRLGGHTLGEKGGARGDWMTTEIVVAGDHAYIAYLGAPWLLAIVNITDPAAPQLVGQFPTTNAWGMDLAVSEDGDWVFVGVYPSAVGEIFTPGYTAAHLGAPAGIAAPGVAVIDARDRTAPVLSSFLPTHGLGPHTVGYHKYPDGREIVFADKADLQVGNAILISELVATPLGGRMLQPLSLWMLDGPSDPDQPHDADAEEHPLTGQTLLYVAHTHAGIAIVDITDPSAPTLVSQSTEGPDGADALVHDVHPYPFLVDGKHYTIASPEIITAETSGTLRIYDTTDPAAPALVGTWRMPGEYVTDEPFGMTMHNFQFLPDGRIALAHGHAGVWLIEWIESRGTAPVATAYYAEAFPDATPPSWSPVSGTPWYWGTAIDARGVLWASDTMGGLVSLGEAAFRGASTEGMRACREVPRRPRGTCARRGP